MELVFFLLFFIFKNHNKILWKYWKDTKELLVQLQAIKFYWVFGLDKNFERLYQQIDGEIVNLDFFSGNVKKSLISQIL